MERIDGTKLVIGEIIDVLKDYKMCDLGIHKDSIIVINHRGEEILTIKLDLYK